MRLIYLFKKMVYEIKINGIKKIFNEMIFFNRKMIVIEHQITHKDDIKMSPDINIEIIDKKNISLIKKKYKKDLFDYYIRKGAICLAAFKHNKCLGYQWWTQNNHFKDLKMLCITLNDNEAYLFNQFVFPEYRGTNIPKLIAQESFNYLIAKGVTKIYGFFYNDNLKAMWWHRAILRCREIKKVRRDRFIFLEYVNGKLMLT